MPYHIKKKGVIIGVHDFGTIWQIDVADRFVKGKPKGRITKIRGDWRPMRDGLDSAFDISSGEFPYVLSKKIYENVIGQEIEYEPDPTFGALSWQPTGRKFINLKVDERTGKVKGLEKLKKVI
jgi:hypothetical protein